MIERRVNESNVTVNAWEEEFEKAYFNGCETCGNGADEDSYKVTIMYSSPDVSQAWYYYDGSFGELIRELDTE